MNQVYKYYYSRVYNETWTSIDELNARLMELNDQYNNEIMKGRTYSRRQKFENEWPTLDQFVAKLAEAENQYRNQRRTEMYLKTSKLRYNAVRHF